MAADFFGACGFAQQAFAKPERDGEHGAGYERGRGLSGGVPAGSAERRGPEATTVGRGRKTARCRRREIPRRRRIGCCAQCAAMSAPSRTEDPGGGRKAGGGADRADPEEKRNQTRSRPAGWASPSCSGTCRSGEARSEVTGALGRGVGSGQGQEDSFGGEGASGLASIAPRGEFSASQPLQLLTSSQNV